MCNKIIKKTSYMHLYNALAIIIIYIPNKISDRYLFNKRLCVSHLYLTRKPVV